MTAAAAQVDFRQWRSACLKLPSGDGLIAEHQLGATWADLQASQRLSGS
jgi:hypothetical protein